MARRRIGALIIIEQETGLAEYIETGFVLDAKLLEELLVALFFPMSPMHDGAVVVKKGRIHSAACLLPLSKNPDIDKRYGTRHRAALGLSEETDAVIIVVSEETQEISVVQGGAITPMRDEVRLELLLKEILLTPHSGNGSFWQKGKSSHQEK
jgi:diadenylate cyclase